MLPGWGNVAWFIGSVGAFEMLIQYIITDVPFEIVITVALLAYGVMWLALGYALWANRSVPAEKN